LRTLRSMSQAVLLVRLIARLAACRWYARLSLPRMRAALEPRPTRGPRVGVQDAVELARLVELAQDVAFPLAPRGCMPRGLTLYHELRKRGMNVALVFGLGRLQDTTQGHCWLDNDGEPFLERTDPRAHFVETYRIA
jgi:hypothetical protein